VAQANTSAWKIFTITNPATGSLTGKLEYGVGANFEIFNLSNSGATSYPAGSCGDPDTTQLNPGASCTVQVRFAPVNTTAPSTTARTGTLTVTDAGSGAFVTVPIQGTATAQLTLSGSAISVVSTVQTLAFGGVATGAQMPETFTIANNGAATTAGSLTLAATIPAGFTVTSAACNVGTILAGATSCDMTLVFTGAASPGLTTTSTTFTGGPAGVSALLALTATTVQPAALALYGFGDLGSAIAPTGVIDLGSVPNTASSGVLTLWFTNTGGVAANTVQSAWTQTGTQFSLAEDPGTCSTVGSLAPKAICSVNVRFIPSATGLQTADLSVFGAAIAAVVVHLQGTGIATSNSVYAQPVAGTNTFYTFAGTTPAGATTGPTAYFVLHNNTPATTLNLGTAADFTGGTPDIAFATAIGRNPTVDFTLSKATTTGGGVACGATLAPAGFCTFAVTFKPVAWVSTATRERWAAVRVSGSNILGVIGQVQQPAQLQLSATATSPVTITGTTSPFLVEFGQILQGQTPSQTFTITNIGQATTAGAPSLNLSAATSTYATIGTSTCTAALIAGASCTVVVNSQLTSTLGVQPPSGSRIAVTAVDTATGGSGETSAETYNLRAEVVNPVSLIATAPSSTAFADTQAGQTAALKTIVVTNGSNTDTLDTRLATSALQVALSDTTNFAVDSSSTCLSSTSSTGYVALPTSTSSSCTLVIKFLPLAAGALSTDVVVTGATPSKVTLTGTGLSDLSITSVTPAVFSGTPLATVIAVKNNGAQTTKLLREKLTGTNASVFAITADTCYGTPLTATGATSTCSVTVTFLGTVTATAQTASLNVTDGTANNTVSVALSVVSP
jgi:hypothetical protein